MYGIKTILGASVATATVAVALLGAGTAHADESSYLDALASFGLPHDSTALAVGENVCADVSANGVAGVDREAGYGISAGLTGEQVGTVIYFAGHELCPENMPAIMAWANAVGGAHSEQA